MKKMFAIVLALMLCVSALSVVAFAAEDTITVYAKVPADWTNVGAYTWEPEDLGSWPGSTMTLNGEWYEIEMPGTHTTVIINSDSAQTVDITIEAGKDVWVTVTDEKDGNGKHIATVSYDGGETSETPEVPETPETPETPAPEVPADANFFVAGSSALCGVEWDPAAEANKMTKGEDGTYSITYAGVAAGEYELKVTAGNWDTCWGNSEGNNVKFSISEAADITVKFNAETGKITVLNGENPITGDMSLAAVSVALLAATAGLVVTVSKKKEF